MSEKDKKFIIADSLVQRIISELRKLMLSQK